MSTNKNSPVLVLENILKDVVSGKCNKFIFVGFLDKGNGEIDFATTESGNLNSIERLAMASFLQAVGQHTVIQSLHMLGGKPSLEDPSGLKLV